MEIDLSVPLICDFLGFVVFVLLWLINAVKFFVNMKKTSPLSLFFSISSTREYMYYTCEFTRNHV